MPATAICWSTYEFFKFILSSKSKEGYKSSVSGSVNGAEPSFQSKSSPSKDENILKSANYVRYVIPKSSVSGNTLHHNAASDLNIAGSQYIPVTSRELPSITVGVYTTGVYDTNFRGRSR